MLHKHAGNVAAVKFNAAARVSMDLLCFEREGEQVRGADVEGDARLDRAAVGPS